MPKKRVRPPNSTKDEVLVACKHSCCICGRPNVQIHHIDEDPSNNDENNLIPLCGYCAGKVHQKNPPASHIQSITPRQLKLYKKKWIETCKIPVALMSPEYQELKFELAEIKGEIKKIKGE